MTSGHIEATLNICKTIYACSSNFNDTLSRECAAAMMKGGTEKLDRGRTQLRNSGPRGRIRSEDIGARPGFVETTLSEIRQRHGSNEKLSSHEIDQLLGHIRRSRSSSVDQESGRGGASRPPPPQFNPPPQPQDTFLLASTPFGPSPPKTRWGSQETKMDAKQTPNKTISQYFNGSYDGSLLVPSSPSSANNAHKSCPIHSDLIGQKQTADQNTFAPSLEARKDDTRFGDRDLFKPGFTDEEVPINIQYPKDYSNKFNGNEELSMIGRSETKNMNSATMTKSESNLGSVGDSCKEPKLTFPAKSDHDPAISREECYKTAKPDEMKFQYTPRDSTLECGEPVPLTEAECKDDEFPAFNLVNDLR